MTRSDPTSSAGTRHDRAGQESPGDEGIAILGLAYGTVALHEHDHSWAAAYASLAEPLAGYLDGLALAIEHVGSTAVGGLCAKPIIDIAAGLTPGSPSSAVRHALTDSGWEFRGDKGADGGLLFVRESAPSIRIAHLHAVTFNCPAWRDYLSFRDLLRTDVSARQQYLELKKQLAAQHRDDRTAYTLGKQTLVRRLLGR